MIYRLPSFPIFCNIWRNGSGPPAPADVLSPCQATPGRREIGPYASADIAADSPANMFILLPVATDIRDSKSAGGPDVCEVPAGSGRLYDVAFVDELGGGFSNEHRFALLTGVPVWPSPFPGGRSGRGAIATLVSEGGSLGAFVNALPIAIVVPDNGILVVTVATYMTTTVMNMAYPGATPISQALSPVLVFPMITAQVWQWYFPVAAGSGTLTIGYPGVLTGILQFNATLLSGPLGVPDVQGLAMANAAAATVGSLFANAVGVETFVAGFSIANPGGLTTFDGGYAQIGAGVNDIVNTVPCTLAVGLLNTSTIGLFPAGLPLLGLTDFCAVVQSYR